MAIHTRRIATLISYVAFGIGTGLLGYWAAINAVIPPDVPIESHPAPTYTIETGTVARALSIPVTASWVTHRTLYAGRDGTLTEVLVESGTEVSAGALIATIDLEPTAIARGTVPMFRALKVGMVGPDVAQLKALLRSLGFYREGSSEQFDLVTEAAVKEWQRSIGGRSDGIVEPGSLLFVETLPARVKVLPTVGERVSAGSDFAYVLAPLPEFQATISATQRAELTTGDVLTIDIPTGGAWTGVLESFEPLDDGRISIQIGGDLCGAQCGILAVDEATAMTGSVVLVPSTTGPVVPMSALLGQPSGKLGVTLADGTVRYVRILAEADGFAVVDGVDSGTVIELPSPPGP